MPIYIFNCLFSSSVICPYFFGRFLYILRMLICYMEQIFFFRSPFASVSVLSLFRVFAQSDGPSPVTSGVPSPVTSGVPSPVTSGVSSPVTSGVPSPVTSGVPSPVTSGLPRLGAVLPGPAPLARGRSPHEGFLYGLRGQNAC